MPWNLFRNFGHEACDSEVQEIVECQRHPDLIKRAITNEESWVYGYDIEIKVISSQREEPRRDKTKKARRVLSNVKVGHQELLRHGRTVNKECYLEVMRRLQYEENIRYCRKRIRVFCITRVHLLTRHCLFVIFWKQTTP